MRKRAAISVSDREAVAVRQPGKKPAANPYALASGEVRAVFDVTTGASNDPEAIAASLQESEDLLALAQEAGGFGIFEWHVQNGTVRLSPKLLSLYGLAHFDGRYETWLGYVFREDVVGAR